MICSTSTLTDSTTETFPFTETVKNKLIRGLYLDIFPLDKLGNTKEEAKKNYGIIQRKLNLMALRQIKIAKKRSFYKNALLFLVQVLPNCIISEKKLSCEIAKLCKRYSGTSYLWGGNLVGAWKFKEVMPLSVFGEPTLYDFEDTKIYGAEHAEQYLENQYGNWRQLPPEEKRVTHHGYYLDLSKPYSDWCN